MYIFRHGLMALLLLSLGSIVAAAPEEILVDGISVAGGLRLTDALKLATDHNPMLAAAKYQVEAADARVVQAGRWANPELEFEVENFGGSDELHGFESVESTLLISQSLQIGGKIKRGREVAESDYAIAGRNWESVELDVRAQTTAAFYSVLTAQERSGLSRELLELAQSFADTVDARVEAGKVSPVEATRARMEVAAVRVQLIRATRELEVARVRLSAMWGTSTADFRHAIGELPGPGDRPAWSELQALVHQTPDMRALDDRLLRSERLVALENSFRIPDLTVAAGPRRFSETGQSAWVAGISLPLPIFDSNKGARRAAEFKLEGSRRDVQAARIEIETGLVSVVQRLDAAVEVATSMEAEVVPAATSALDAVEIGYTEGKFGFLDVIDAQRTLFDARSILLDSIAEYALARVDLERLIGRNLGTGDVTTSPAVAVE
ncbi:MAG: TolC family protein [Deltaproteobacteria bacterium]|nr:TolC family protein [Deltaproteobacteria bacterium]